jgi:hypothetical protein
VGGRYRIPYLRRSRAVAQLHVGKRRASKGVLDRYERLWRSPSPVSRQRFTHHRNLDANRAGIERTPSPSAAIALIASSRPTTTAATASRRRQAGQREPASTVNDSHRHRITSWPRHGRRQRQGKATSKTEFNGYRRLANQYQNRAGIIPFRAVGSLEQMRCVLFWP